MAKLWGVKDGPRPKNQSEPPLEVTMAELVGVFKDVAAQWLGTEPPSITPQQEPSDWPRYTVAEIEASDGANAKFPQPGFYLMEGLAPSRAEGMIEAHRAKVTDSGSPKET